MRNYEKLLNDANDSRYKKYYNLTDLMDMTGMSIRALKYRMLDVKKKYENVPTLLYKKNREWNIHYTIINEFEPKYKIKTSTIYNYAWKSMATWNPKFNYDPNYHVQLVNEIKTQLPKNKFSYAIELDGRGINHTHVISDAEQHELNKAVIAIVEKYIGKEDCQVKVEPIHNKYSTVDYLSKAPVKKGVL